MSKKVLIIGIEGLSRDTMLQLIKQNQLPNLAKILKNGTLINLKSELPLVSPVTWTSLSTGENPGKHGIFGWQQCESYKTYIPVSTDVKAKTLWEILSEHGKRSIIINVYLTYPSKNINGIIIAGMPSPFLSTFPPELKEEIEKNGYKVEARGYVYTPKEEFIKDLYNTTEARAKTALELMKSKDWNLFFVLFTGVDRLNHYLWKDLEERTKYGEEALEYYKFLDEKIGEIVKKAGNSTIFIVSDHGFRRVKKRFHVNQWLIKEGYLKLKPTPRNFINSLLLKLFSLLKKYRMTGLLSKFLRLFWGKTFEIESPHFDIDYNKSKAFTCSFYETSIYINPKLKSKEREKVKGEIVRKLKALKDPETNENVFKEVYTNTQIYKGPYLNISPDIILFPAENYSAVGGFTFSGLFESNLRETGTHKFGGFLIVNKKNIKRKEASLRDVAPTILKLMNLKIPEDMDGKSLI